MDFYFQKDQNHLTFFFFLKHGNSFLKTNPFYWIVLILILDMVSEVHKNIFLKKI